MENLDPTGRPYRDWRRWHISGDSASTDRRPDVAAVGEFGLVERVVARLSLAAGVVVGPGDDAAVVTAPDGRVVVTTDMLVEGRHFRRDWSSAEDVGHRAAAASLADVAAMGGRPTALVVGLAAPPRLSVEWAEALTDGLRDEAAVVGASVVGGDVVRSDVLTISVTALGDLEGRDPVMRGGAAPGDLVVLAGRLGWAAAGLRLLHAGVETGRLADAHRRPAPPYAAGPLLARLGATAMVDVSDGLTADLRHVADESGLGVDLDLEAIRALGTDGVVDDDLLFGGDDHALVATLPATVTVPDGLHVIGRTCEGSGVRVDGREVSGGHDHFAPRS